jgi:Ca2+-binding EF-hand superfamily protein
MFEKYDGDKDGMLTYEEFTKALSDCKLKLGDNLI